MKESNNVLRNPSADDAFGSIWENFRNKYYPFYAAFYIIEEETRKKAHLAHMHFHDHPQTLYCIKGSYTHTVGNVSYECSSGSLIIVPPGVPHSYTVAKGKRCDFVQLNILLNFLDDFSDTNQISAAMHLFLHTFSKELKHEAPLHIQLRDKDKEFADRILLALCEHNWTKQINTYRSLRRMFFSLFSLNCFRLSEKTLLRIQNFVEKKYIPLTRTVYYMNLNYNRKITAEELIALSDLCSTHYFRYIKKLLGVTFSTYLQRIRVNHAAMLCKFSRYSFSYIADMCGFGNQAYMNNRIKKLNYFWTTPSQMRQSRSDQISKWPDMVMSRDDYEKLTPHFHAFGL